MFELIKKSKKLVVDVHSKKEGIAISEIKNKPVFLSTIQLNIFSLLPDVGTPFAPICKPSIEELGDALIFWVNDAKLA